ncbi:MAG: SDR family oxidoreductase [Sphingobacteriales bacterium]|nr:SDR family oxidoreductase [Sphingobacteriales bacterium]
MSKKILVTGSNGLLGQKLTDMLRYHSDYELIASSKGENRYPETVGYTYEQLDVTDYTDIERLIVKYQPYAVIHTAAMTNVDQCESEKEACQKLNVDSVAHLIKLANQHPFYLVHLSTDFIFDGTTGPYKETDAPNPLSLYGHSKNDAELLLLASNINYSILRTIIVYGVAAAMSRSNIVLWAKGALEKGSPIKVVNDQYRMPTLAEDLAKACILAIEKRAQGIFHISGKDYMSVIEMVRRIAKFFKLDDSIIEETDSSTLNQAAARPPKTGFVLDKAIHELGYAPHSFEEGLAVVQKQLV